MRPTSGPVTPRSVPPGLCSECQGVMLLLVESLQWFHTLDLACWRSDFTIELEQSNLVSMKAKMSA
jgi:hypothetical protein